MPLAEEADVIIPLGAWVMREAARLAKQLQNGEASLTVAFNVAAPQFADPAFLDRLDMALDETGANPANLEMEITESVAIADPAKAKRLLSEVRARGLSIALDDFGTGYSSLTHLREFPVDVVKIDRSFITTLPEAEESALIVGAVIQLSHRLGSRVQAEGVETEAQRQWLLGEGCDLAQGFLISSPLELSLLHEFLAGAVA